MSSKISTIMAEEIIVFGETNFRNRRERFGIKTDDRRRHMYIIGKTGMGKTELLKNMIVQDIQEGRGIAFVDPHGDTADALLDYIPENRIKDVIYFDPSDMENPIAFNVLEKVQAEYRHLVASGLMGVFKKIWQDAWSARMEYILNNAILALLEVDGSTLLGINRMFSDKEYRQKIVSQITDPIVRSFWVDEFARYTDRLAVEATAAIQNKVGQFTSSSLVRNIIGQVRTSVNIREVMDSGKILIMNLSRGKIGEDASRLLGALFITKIQLAAMSRVDIPENERKDFYLYVDEFQHFATESFANILSEARKFRLNLVIAHQYIAQMDEKVRDAVFGNVGTIITFRVGAEDAEALEKEFSPEFMMNDIVNLPKFNVYLKLMIDGVASQAFSAGTLPPFPSLEKSLRAEIIEFSKAHYGTPRKEIEEKIAAWAQSASQSATAEKRPYQKKDFGPRGPNRFNDRDSQNRYPKLTEQSFRQAQNISEPPIKKTSPLSIEEAVRQEPVDFKGRKIEKKEDREKQHKEPDLEGLRNILGAVIKKGDS